MGERKDGTVLVVTVAALLAGIGCYLGELRGERLMKRWQDTYYQAHPVVKEVPPKFTFDGADPLYDSDGKLVWMGGSTGSITLPAEREIHCDSSVAPGDGWLPLTSAPHDGTIVEIAETYGYTPWYDFYQFVDGGWKQASDHAYGLNGEKCGYWRPRRTAPTRSDN